MITRYEIEPAAGVKGSQIVNLVEGPGARAVGRSASASSRRSRASRAWGSRSRTRSREIVRARRDPRSQAYDDAARRRSTLALGKDIAGKPVVADLARMPHLLVAGTTGSGKSVALNAMILSLLYKADAEHVRLIMIDPKMLELSVYEGIPHLLAPVVTDMKQAANALHWCVGEMERRYKLMIGARRAQPRRATTRRSTDATKAASRCSIRSVHARRPMATASRSTRCRSSSSSSTSSPT